MWWELTIADCEHIIFDFLQKKKINGIYGNHHQLNGGLVYAVVSDFERLAQSYPDENCTAVAIQFYPLCINIIFFSENLNSHNLPGETLVKLF